MEGGYSKDIFVEPIDDHLLCQLCSNVLRGSKTTPCGHVFCQGCIDHWVKEYGVCPKRCRELEVQDLSGAVHIDARISGLKTRCQNSASGCIVQVPLCEKQKHESTCPYLHIVGLGASRQPQPVATEDEVVVEEEPNHKKESLGFFQRTKLVLSFRSAKSSRRTNPPKASSPKKVDIKLESQGTAGMQAQRTFRLKRNRPREPLGLVLMSGDKTGDGRHKSYYVKKVNRDSLGWRAGILAGDRIIKVDNFELWRMTPQESVARIKERTVITLTVLRETGNMAAAPNRQHIYDEIMYSDLSQQNLSQNALSQPGHDENHPPTPPPINFGKYGSASQQNLLDHEEPSHKPPKAMRPTSPAAHLMYRTSSSGQGERTSKDSGLSSGSSDSPNPAPKQSDSKPVAPNHGLKQPPPVTLTQNLEREIKARQSYRTEKEMMRTFLKTQRRNSPAAQEPVPSRPPTRSRNCRIVGEYEFEDIYLEKNGTSQLGITLGYDSSAAKGSCLYVCEVVSGGLAAQNGRLRTGDIIKRVNGFQVYDPEEAILLFLEQDQDITLSVARKIKIPSKLRPRPEMDLDYLESTILRNGHGIRKVDSCGSLDSRTHDYAILEPPNKTSEKPLQQPDELEDLPMLQVLSQDSHQYDENPYQSRRSSVPSGSTKLVPLSGGYKSQKITGSSPNLLLSPPALSQPMARSHFGNARSTNRIWALQERPSSTTPDKQYRPRGIVKNQHKTSTPSLSSPVVTPTTTSVDHEPKIMVPPAPTQVLPSFRGLANEIRRLPNRFESNNIQDPSSGAACGRRESLV